MHTSQVAAAEAGDPMVTWDPATITGEGISTIVPVVVMDAPKGSVSSTLVGGDVKTGEELFTT